MKSKYAILCGSRTGSTHLCDLLKATRRAGNPEEFFNTSMDFSHLKNGKGFVDSIVNGTKTENDVFGVKIVGLDQLENYANSTLEFTHCVYLNRKDKIAQAISRYKSWKTGVWHVNNKNKTIPDVDYSFKGVKWCLEEIETEEAIFKRILDESHYFEISYEDIVENPDQSIHCVLDYLGISTEELPDLISGQQKVSGRDSIKWKQRFLEDKKNDV